MGHRWEVKINNEYDTNSNPRKPQSKIAWLKFQSVSNLWEEQEDWLCLSDPGVTPILALAVDPLTENIFYIVPNTPRTIEQVLVSTRG